jgi:ParB family chromosome partitioning protein
LQDTSPQNGDPRPSKLPIAQIAPNPHQPRETFDEDSIRDLADSVRRHGLLQPVAVMPGNNDNYLIVAGERRWRAAQQAGLKEIPVVFMDPLTPQELLECALVENLQREDLHPLDEARAYHTLAKSFSLSAEQIAERVGKSRSAVSNTLRLLNLPVHLLLDLQEGRLTAGHARALLSVENPRDQSDLRDAILHQGLSVRQAEMRAQELAVAADSPRRTKKQRTRGKSDPDANRLRERLVEALACNVSVKALDKDRGRIEIYYESIDELQRVLSRLGIEES